MRPYRLLGCLAAVAILGAASGVHAQYEYDPSNLDEQGTATRYFGSIKDERGKPLPDSGVIAQRSYVFITDKAGRFSGHAPDPSYKSETIGCAKAGYTVVRIKKRFGATNQKHWVEVDCVLRKAR